jgi:hypothetical protein
MATKKKVILTHALEAECKKAGLNPRKVDDLARELGRIGRKAQTMGLKVFGGSGNGMGAFRCGNPLERIVGFSDKCLMQLSVNGVYSSSGSVVLSEEFGTTASDLCQHVDQHFEIGGLYTFKVRRWLCCRIGNRW